MQPPAPEAKQKTARSAASATARPQRSEESQAAGGPRRRLRRNRKRKTPFRTFSWAKRGFRGHVRRECWIRAARPWTRDIARKRSGGSTGSRYGLRTRRSTARRAASRCRTGARVALWHGKQERGAVAEWSKAHAWKVCIRQKRIEGSNPSCSATWPGMSSRSEQRPAEITAWPLPNRASSAMRRSCRTRSCWWWSCGTSRSRARPARRDGIRPGAWPCASRR